MLTKSSSTCLFIVIFILSLPLSKQDSYQPRRYIHVLLQTTWSLAQKYCREHHIDLVSFSNGEEFSALPSPCNHSALCWIGLQRDEKDPNVWNWSDGEESNFANWNSHFNQPDNYLGNQNCVAMGKIFWYDLACDDKLNFLCYDNPILVKENKTWEEALEHCRTLDTDPNSSNTLNHLYDLPHMVFGGDNLYASRAIRDAQTPEVWIGLRFLAGKWLWVNGMPLQEQLHACPAPSMYCGTMSKTGELLPLRDCLERRNFFCSIRAT